MGAPSNIRARIRAGAAIILCLLGVLYALPQAWAADPAPGTHIPNTAAVNYNFNGSPMPQVTAFVDAVVIAPSISLTETAYPESVTAGDDVTYTLTVRNTGSVYLAGMELTDPIPRKATFVSADSGGTFSSGTVSWVIGGLSPSQSQVVHLIVKTDSGAAGSVITDDSTVTSGGVPQQRASAVVNVTAPLPIGVKFCDSSWEKTYQYNIGDMIYVQVTDKNLEPDPSTPGTVAVTVSSYEGPNSQGVYDSVTFTLSETAPGTGIFRGGIISNGGPPVSGDGALSLDSDSRLRVVYTDPVSKISTVDDTALVDPYGRVFDSATGQMIAGATVTLVDNATGRRAILPQPPTAPETQQNPVTTGADGAFRFKYLNPGNYHVVVSPGSGYIFPSAVPAQDLPKGYNITAGSYGREFIVKAKMQPFDIDMPTDPPASALRASKTADRNAAAAGDIVRYTVTIQNTGKTDVAALAITDDMPRGIHYLKGSATIGGKKAPDPAVSGRELTFAAGAVPAGESAALYYSASVGPDSQEGTATNTAFAVGSTATGVLVSNKARFSLIVNGGVFTSKGLIIGKIFWDKNHDKVQEKGEEGIPGAVIYMEDGTRVVTGTDGKYSIFGVTPGTHVLRVDETSLPKGAALEALSNRFMGDGSSQFVDMPMGGLFKADFAVTGNIGPIKTKTSAVNQPRTVRFNPQGTSALPVAEKPLKKRIRQMSPVLEILSPKDGATAYIDKVKITVKAPVNAVLSLYVNGEEVKKHLGKAVKDPVSGVAVYEFISVGITPGEKNIIMAETKDASGKVTGTKEITLHASGRPEKIVVTPDNPEIPADGKTVTEFSVKILDGKGAVVGYPGTVTVETSKGEILDKDADPAEPGTQFETADGLVKFHLKSPWQTGKEKITVSCNGVTTTVPVFFSPYLRKMIAVGEGEVAIGYGSTRNGQARTFMSDNWLNNNFFFGGRGAFFAKGDIGWGTLLTATYDSAKQKQDVGLFKSTISNVESENVYPILGDDSKVGYEALSSDKLYLRAEKGRSSVTYGDFQTGLNEGGLSAYNRTFTGLVTDVDTRHFKMRSFASHTENVQVVDAIPGKGIAGYYFLSKAPVLEGSEMVVIETRDWRQPERVISRVPMTRWTDYTIDYEMGSILFRAPVPVRDENFNPVYIIVSYENLGTEKHYVYGGRAAIDPFSWLEAGFTGIVEQNDVSDFRLLGSDVTAHLPLKTTLKGEWAQTDSLFNLDSVFTPKVGSAWSLKLCSNPINNLKASGYYYNVGEFFNNPSAVNYQRGKKSYGADIDYNLANGTDAYGKFFVEDDRLNHMHDDFASAGLKKTFLKIFKAGLDFQYQESTEKFVPFNLPTTRFPFDNSEETPNKLTALKIFLSAKPWKDLTLSVDHTQDVLHNRDNLTEAGVEYQYSQSSRFYVREQYMTIDDRSQTRTVAGTESTIAKNTVAFDEYRLIGGADGSRNEQSIGLRRKFDLGYGVTGNASVEDLRTLSGKEKQAEPDSFASSLGLEYLTRKDFKATSRFEYRHATGDTSYLAELGGTYKFNRDFFLLL
ncbi:MAG: carboxypeptidase regulatory-like domain-containing protein, partial [Nitrospirota bacterium]